MNLKWEYRVVRMFDVAPGFRLNLIGEEGWELCAVHEPAVEFSDRSTAYIFKRRVL